MSYECGISLLYILYIGEYEEGRTTRRRTRVCVYTVLLCAEGHSVGDVLND